MAKKAKLPLIYSNMPKNPAWFVNITGSIRVLTYVPKTNDFCIELTDSNAKLIQNAVASDPDYNADFSGIVFNHYRRKLSFNGTSNKTIVQHVVRMVDYENSTCAWRMKGEKRQSLLNIVDYICDPANGFWDRVSHYDADLVDDLTGAATSYNGAVGTRSISLASKVCRFFNQICFRRDDYYAYDSVVRWTLDYFRNAYGLPTVGCPFVGNYKTLHCALDNLRIAAAKRHGHSITRYDMDQIMWFCYK